MAEPEEKDTLTVRYFAAARAAAGTETETVPVPAGCTVDGLVERIGNGRPSLANVLARCSFLLDEVAVRDRSRVVPRGCTMDVLPPFAGG